MKNQIQKAIDLQIELNAIKKEFHPKLLKIAAQKHRNLIDISLNDIEFYSDSITFKASGTCCGYFEDYFDITLEDLGKID